jgi:erythromycin esterase
MTTKAVFLLVVVSYPLLACSPSSSPPVEVEDPVTPEMVAWLRDQVIPFDTDLLRDDRSDLMPLLDIVGDARVVALGEATYGTAEFSRIKHRILDFLVHEMGFNLLSVEASWPEANRVNDYVLRGEGDPEMNLAGLYSWALRTRSVLDMIHWMRSHNQNPGGAPSVSFLGFDMLYPGMAIDNILGYLDAVDRDSVLYAGSRLSCIDKNDYLGQFFLDYGDRDAESQNRCREGVDEVYAFLEENRETYQAASSPQDFARALQSVRLVQQWESMKAERIPDARDVFMAENALWLLEQGGPDAKLVLWTHNRHMATRSGTMGEVLRGALGDDLVTVGLDFYAGELTVVLRTNGAYQGLVSQAVHAPPLDTYEHYFQAAGIPRFLLDLRGVDYTTSATQWLVGPRPMRSVGATYDFYRPSTRFVSDTRLPLEYDVMIYVEDSHATEVLTLEYPTEF